LLENKKKDMENLVDNPLEIHIESELNQKTQNSQKPEANCITPECQYLQNNNPD